MWLILSYQRVVHKFTLMLLFWWELDQKLNLELNLYIAYSKEIKQKMMFQSFLFWKNLIVGKYLSYKRVKF
jgi:hypothetical protein